MNCMRNNAHTARTHVTHYCHQHTRTQTQKIRTTPKCHRTKTRTRAHNRHITSSSRLSARLSAGRVLYYPKHSHKHPQIHTDTHTQLEHTASARAHNSHCVDVVGPVRVPLPTTTTTTHKCRKFAAIKHVHERIHCPIYGLAVTTPALLP